MPALLRRFIKYVEENELFGKSDPILLAVSGGIDSAVMAQLFHEASFNFGIAHVNFQLRGNDSEEDEKFVRSLASARDKKFFTTRFDTSAFSRENDLSIQMAARELRYSWLEQVRKENGFHRIAVAHHLDDSIETTLINIFRGTGIHGLHGILPKQNKIVRPLLSFYKHELEEYVLLHGLAFRQDQSNFETDYDRNKIRLEIIPVIEKHFPSFKKIFSENILKWQDAELLNNEAFELAKKKIIEHRGDELWISISKLKLQAASKTILFELLKDFDFNSDQVNQIAAALESESGKMFFSPGYRLIKDRKHLIVSPVSSSSLTEVLILEDEKKIAADKIELQLSFHPGKDFSIPREKSFSCLDKGELEYPLLLRRWKKGDYFYPFGMKRKKKKISDYLIDKKIPLSEKENTWVLESGKRIACIIGERIDERFKVTDATKEILLIELLKK